MLQQTGSKKQGKSSDQGGGGREPADESDDMPSMSERARSGMKIAGQLRKAAAGGKLRKGFSLWRVSRELPTAAAGAGDFFKRHPVPIALLGGALTTATLLVLATGMGAFDEQGEQDDEAADDESTERAPDEAEDE
jgi:hypothetical protein